MKKDYNIDRKNFLQIFTKRTRMNKGELSLLKAKREKEIKKTQGKNKKSKRFKGSKKEFKTDS